MITHDLQISKSAHKRIAMLARRDGVSVNHWCVQAIGKATGSFDRQRAEAGEERLRRMFRDAIPTASTHNKVYAWSPQ